MASGSTNVQNVVARTKVELQEKNLLGQATGFNDVLVEKKIIGSSNTGVTLSAGQLDTIDIKGESINLILGASTKVSNLNIEGEKAKVLGQGHVLSACVNAESASFEKKPSKMEVAAGIGAPMIKTSTTVATSGGSSSGGGGGGGHSSSSGSSSNNDTSSENSNTSKPSITTVSALQSAIADNAQTNITLQSTITGDVIATRAASGSLTINFNGYSINGNLDISADQASSITLNNSNSEKITGDFIIDAPNASVTNNVIVGGKAIIENVAYHSYKANKTHAGGIDVKGRARIVVAPSVIDVIVNIQSEFPVVLSGLVDELNVESSMASAIVEGTINKINIKKGAKNAEIQVAKDAKVKHLKADEHINVLAENIDTLNIDIDTTGIATVSKKIAHLVQFNENGGDALPVPSFLYVTDKTQLGLLPSTPVRKNYVFKGWNTEANGTGSVVNEATIVSRATTFYAQWEAIPVNTYAVTFESNGGTFITPIYGILANGHIKLPTNPQKSGYDFAGWYMDTKFKTAFTTKTDITRNITAYAKWTAIEALDANIDYVSACGNSLVHVDFSNPVNTSAANNKSNYRIVEKNTNNEIAVLSVDVFDSYGVFIKTEAMTAGKAYTLMVNDSKANFTGLAKDSNPPHIASVRGIDNGLVEIKFKDTFLDKSSAENIDNYSIIDDGKIIKAEVNSTLDAVLLTITDMTSLKANKLTMSNITSSDGVVMEATTKSFTAKFDNIPPSIDEVEASEHNNVEVLIAFNDEHGIDKETAENVSNYSIEGLEILSAEAIYSDSSLDTTYYDKVILTTSEQVKSKAYQLNVKYMVDGSTACNATTEVLTEKFRGGTADDHAPKVKSVEYRNSTEIELTFFEDNALDVATALNTSNYLFDYDALGIINVKLSDPDENGNTYDAGYTGSEYRIGEDADEIKVILTVTPMEEDESYRLIVNNIADNFANVMEEPESEIVRMSTEIKSYARIYSISANDLEEISVTFDMPLDEKSAEDPTNYVLDKGIGAAKEAILASDRKTVVLLVPKMKARTVYKLTVNNVLNDWGYACKNMSLSFIANSDEIDNEQPQVIDLAYVNKGELIVTFSEAMDVTLGKTSVKVENLNGTSGERYYNLVAVEQRLDDTQVVFNAYSGTNTTNSNNILPSDSRFNVLEFSIITDFAGNSLNYTSADKSFNTAPDGYHASEDAVKVDQILQKNGNTIEILFDQSIGMKGWENQTIISVPYDDDDDDDDDFLADDGTMSFTYAIIDDKTLKLTKASGTFPDEPVTLYFDFYELEVDSTSFDYDSTSFNTTCVMDILDRPAKSEVIKLSVSNHDEMPPMLTEVEVVDNVTIKLHFNEKLKTTGTYKIVNIDNDYYQMPITYIGFEDESECDTVIIQLRKRMTTTNYEVFIVASPRDLANNEVADESVTWPFVGVNTMPAYSMVGAVVKSSTLITVINNEEDFASGIGANEFAIKKNGIMLPSSAFEVEALPIANDELDIHFNLYHALLYQDAASSKVEYTMTLSIDGVAKYYTVQPFTGTLEESSITNLIAGAVTSGAATTVGTNVYKANYVTFASEWVDIDPYEYVYRLVSESEDDAGIVLMVNSGTTYTDNTITEETTGEITITSSSFLPDRNYRLILEPKDRTGSSIGTIEVITEPFQFN